VIYFGLCTVFGVCILRSVPVDQYALVGYLCIASPALIAEYTAPPLKFKYRALGETCLFVWALHYNALFGLVALGRSPFSPAFVAVSTVAALLRAYPNYCFNVRDALADALTPGLCTIAILIGADGIRKSYWVSVILVLPMAACVLAASCGWPSLLLLLLLPLGLSTAKEVTAMKIEDLASSWGFYDYTQYFTLAALAIPTVHSLMVGGC
jgi:1,4-dihydroxy-2-naphthoate octaprenyltransferase